MRPPAVLRLSIMLGLAVALAPVPAHAHTLAESPGAIVPLVADAAVPMLRGPAASVAPVWLLVALVAALLVTATRSPIRRALGVTLVLLLAVLAVEQSVHSVHHLADARGSDCVMAAWAGHSVAVQGDVPWLPSPVLATRSLLERLAPPALGIRLGPDPARAPPFAIA